MTQNHTAVPNPWPSIEPHEPASGAGRTSRLTGLLLDPVGQLGDLVVDTASLGEQLPDLLVGVHDRGVVAAAELLADLGQRQLGELAAEVHRDLPAGDQHPAAART